MVQILLLLLVVIVDNGPNARHLHSSQLFPQLSIKTSYIKVNHVHVQITKYLVTIKIKLTQSTKFEVLSTKP